MKQIYDSIIIGAGITGVSVARLLQKKGNNNFIILEKSKEPGGLCRSINHQGHNLDIGGGHFLCTKYPEVYDFIFEHIPKSKFNFYPRVSKIEIEDTIIDYPVEANIWQLPIKKLIEYLISAMQSGEQLKKKEPKNYEEWIHWKLGEKIANNYMLPYNKKIWGVNPSEMDIDWLHKIPRLDLTEILRSSLEKNSDPKFMPSHSGFYYPKKGGFQVIFDSIYKEIKGSVVLDYQIKSIRKKGGVWVINNEIYAKKVINTAPWTALETALSPASTLKKHFKNLKSNSIVVSLFESKYSHNWHWLYVPEIKKKFHRLFYISNFSESSKRGGIYSETNIKRWSKNNTMEGKRPIYEHKNEYAYPIPVLNHVKSIDKILKYYEKKSLYGVGRWGQWNYFNSDVCIKEAMNFVNRIY